MHDINLVVSWTHVLPSAPSRNVGFTRVCLGINVFEINIERGGKKKFASVSTIMTGNVAHSRPENTASDNEVFSSLSALYKTSTVKKKPWFEENDIWTRDNKISFLLMNHNKLWKTRMNYLWPFWSPPLKVKSTSLLFRVLKISEKNPLTYLYAKNISSFSWFYRVQGSSFLFIVLVVFLLAFFQCKTESLLN